MSLEKNEFITRLQQVVGLDKKQAEDVYKMLLDEGLIPSQEGIKEVPIEGKVIETTPINKEKEDDYLVCKEYEGHEINDKKNKVAFFKHENGKYYFALYNADGSVKLRSEGFITVKERDQELFGVVRLHDEPKFYSEMVRGNFYMDVLRDETGREVGRSCMHTRPAPKAEVFDPAKITTATASVQDQEDDYLSCKAYEGHPVSDQTNNVAFFNHSNGQFYFAVYNQDGSVKLRSEGFKTITERDEELSGVIRLQNNKDYYKRQEVGKYFLDTLYNEKGIEIGRSCLHQDKASAAITMAAPGVIAPSPKASVATVPLEDRDDEYLSCPEYEGHPVNDKNNNVALFKHTNGQFYFALYHKDGAVKLRSEGFLTSRDRDQELSGVVRLHANKDYYKRREVGKYFMDILYNEKGVEVGRSCLHQVGIIHKKQ